MVPVPAMSFQYSGVRTTLKKTTPGLMGSAPGGVYSSSIFRPFTAELSTWSADRFAATLKDKELEIFRSRLLSEDPPTLQEVGRRFGISRERVRQIEARLKKRLKLFLKSQASDIEQAGP